MRSTLDDLIQELDVLHGRLNTIVPYQSLDDLASVQLETMRILIKVMACLRRLPLSNLNDL